jgi:hypothetical protein
MKSTNKSDSVIGYLAAIAPALLQLIGVLSVGLIDVLKLSEYVFSPGFINIANFLVILLSISIISMASFWDYNRFALSKNKQDPFSDTKRFWKILKFTCILAILGTLAFVIVVIEKPRITSNIELYTLFQWLGYITSMVSVSFIIYSFVLLKIQEKRNRELYENYIPRLFDSLHRNGHIKNPDIQILNINRNELQVEVRLGGESKYRVSTDYIGEMVSIEGLK